MEKMIKEALRGARGLGHNKQSKIVSRNARPENHQGQDGDMQMIGGFLYVKNRNEWFEFASQPSSTTVGPPDYLAEENGFIKLAGGIIIQWGKIAVDATEEAVTFPIPFPTSAFNISCTAEDTNDTGGHASGLVIHGDLTTSGFNVSTVASWNFVYWIAIGY